MPARRPRAVCLAALLVATACGSSPHGGPTDAGGDAVEADAATQADDGADLVAADAADAASDASDADADADAGASRVFYLSPGGSDTNAGTSAAAPWKTFRHAIPLLAPGETLVLLDGEYNDATGTGYLQVECRRVSDNPACMNTLPACTAANVPRCSLGANSEHWIPTFAQGRSGTATAPITVRAMNPRQAYLRGDGSEIAPVFLSNCAYWTIDGLRARDNDGVRAPVAYHDGTPIVDQGTAGVFQVTCSDHVTLRRLYGEYNNRLYNTDVIGLYSSRSSQVVDSEAYNHHRHGMSACCRGPTFVVDMNQYALNTALISASDVAFQRDYVDAQPTPGGTPCDARGWSTAGASTAPGRVLCGYDLVCDYQTPSLCGNIRGTEAWCTGLAAGARCANHANSHGAGTQGDEGITQYWTDGGTIENSITLHGEGQHATGSNTHIESAVVLASSQGVHLGRNQSGQGGYVDYEGHNVAHNALVVGEPSDGTGLFLCAGSHDRASKITVVGAYRGVLGAGWGSTLCQPALTGTPRADISFEFEDVLVIGARAAGSNFAAAVLGAPDCWHGAFVNVSAGVSANNYSPAVAGTPNWSDATTLAVTGMYDPTAMRGDLVWIPAGSNLATAGATDEGGAPSSLGANVTCLYDRGVNTGGNMWDAAGGTGRFAGCSWYADASPADVAASEGYAQRCSNVHRALNIGVNGGSIPACITSGPNAVNPTFRGACP